MRKIKNTQTTAATWAADGTISTAIERIGLITRINATVEVTPSATLDGQNQPDGLFRLIQNLRIQGGSATYFNLPADDGCQGGVLQHYRALIDGLGVGHESGDVAAPSASYVPIDFPIHIGSRPQTKYGIDNPFDLSAFIPANKESQLVAEWTTSGNDVMDDTVTIASAVMRFTISRVTGSHEDIAAEMQRQGVAVLPGNTGWIPQYSSTNFAIGATSTDFVSQSVDVPSGAFLRRIFIIAQDATADRALRAADQISEIQLRNSKAGENLLEVGVEVITGSLPFGSNMLADDAALDFGNQAPHGIYPVDLRPHMGGPVGEDYGLNLIDGDNADAWKLGFIIDNRAQGDDALISWERYVPTAVGLDG